jgi:membrane protease subunit HflC
MSKTLKILIPIVCAVLLIIVLGGSLVVTQANEYTIIRQFGAVVRIIDQPGLSLKTPFVQSASTLPKTEMLYDLAVSDVITSDKKSMVADSFVLWRIDDPLKFIQTLSGSVATAESRLDQAVYNSLKTVISSMKQEAVISGRDGELASAIMENLRKTSNFESFGIYVLAIETKQIDLPDENKSAVYERMISERENIAASYAAEGAAQAKEIRNDADKSVDITISAAKAQAEKLKAEGEAEYMRILSAAYDTQEKADFYEFVRALDMARSSLTGKNKTLVVGSDSPIAQIFDGSWRSAE